MMTREMRMEMVGESQDEKHWGCIALRLKGAVVSLSPLQAFPPLKTKRTNRKFTGMAMANTGNGASASGIPSHTKRLSSTMWSR